MTFKSNPEEGKPADGKDNYRQIFDEGFSERKRLEQQLRANLKYFESMDQVNRAIHGANDLNQMMSDVLETVLSIFDSDRIWLFYPCDPDAPFFRVPMEITKSEYPGAGILNVDVPMPSDMAKDLKDTLEATGPVTFAVGTEKPINEVSAKQFGVKSMMMLALYPKTGKPWAFGLHQCSHPRVWTPEEKRLFQEIGRRLSDGLTSILAYRDLEESKQRYQQTYDNVSDSLILLDVEVDSVNDICYRLADMNPAAEKIHCISRLRAIGRTFAEIALPEVSARCVPLFNRCIESGKEYSFEETLNIPGNTRHIYTTIVPVRDNSGEVIRLLAVEKDITELKQVEKELRKTNAELEEHRLNLESVVEERTQELARARDAAESANRSKSIFLANMSHELRTPLNAILGFTQLMSRDETIPEKARSNLAIVNRSGEHLLSMINDVLDLSKIEAGKVELREESFDLVGTMEDVGEMIRSRARGKGLEFLIEIDSDLERFVFGDLGKIRQMLINLLGNAIKFTESGGVALRSRTIRQGDDNSQVLLDIEIEDTGPGIAKDRIDSIFVPFSQVGSIESSLKGTGLGLTISQSFARMMGGKISVKSEEGKGSVFSFQIPIKIAEESSVAVVKLPSKSVVGLEPGQPKRRVLVVDDSPENVQLLKTLLTRVGFSVRTACNGQEGIEVAQEWRPHFIWMDIRMPVLDGHEATRRIRTFSWAKDMVIVAVTASVFTDQESRILDAGCDAVLHKPYRDWEIYDTMGKFLGIRYIYKKSETGKSKDNAVSGAELAVLPAEIKALSQDIVARITQAAVELDKSAIFDISTEIEANYPTAASLLKNHAVGYNFEAIKKMMLQIEPTKKNRKTNRRKAS